MRWWSKEFIFWWQTKATPEQKRILRNIWSRKRFTRWAIARNHWWGRLRDAVLGAVIIFGLAEVVVVLIWLLGKVIWWH